MKALLFGLLLASGATAWAVPDPRDSIILESKTVSPGASPGDLSDTTAYVYLKVWITNKDTLAAIVLSYEEKSLFGGAYLVAGHPRDFEGTVSSLTFTLPTVFASYSGYDSQSPDSVHLSAAFISGPPIPRYERPNLTRKPFWELKFDSVPAAFGQVQLDSLPVPGHISAGFLDVPGREIAVNFVKAIITVAQGPQLPVEEHQKGQETESTGLNKNQKILNLPRIEGLPIQFNNAFESSSGLSKIISPNQVTSGFPNIRMHPNPATTQSELSMVLNPTNPNKVLAGANTIRDVRLPVPDTAVSQGWYYTATGGSSWSGRDTFPTHDSLSWIMFDPAVAIDRDGNLFFNAIFDNGQGVVDVFVAKSTDSGTSWTQTIVPDGSRSEDKDHLAIDINSISPYRNYIYTAYTDGFKSPYPIKFSRSIDRGASFSSPKKINDSIYTLGPCNFPLLCGIAAHGANLAVGPNGELYSAWLRYKYDYPRLTDAFLEFNKSLDGGGTWGEADTIRSVKALNHTGGTITLKNSIRANSFPSMAVDRSTGPKRGWIYIVWAEKDVSRPDSTPDIMLIRSTDGGVSWSASRKVNQDNSGKDQWSPWIAVDPANGSLFIVYYDSRNFSQNDSAQVYISFSINGGDTFQDTLVSDAAFLPASIAGAGDGYMGDYIGIAALNNIVWPAWNDNRTGIHQAYTAKLDFNGGGGPILCLPVAWLDVNQDNMLSLVDVAILLNCVFLNSMVSCESAWTTADVVMLLNGLFSPDTRPPAC